MNATTVAIRKARFNDLPTLWDGESTWCVSVGPYGAAPDASICTLYFRPPNELKAGLRRVVFDVVSPDQDTVNAVIMELGRSRHALEAQRAILLLADLGIVRNPVLE